MLFALRCLYDTGLCIFSLLKSQCRISKRICLTSYTFHSRRIYCLFSIINKITSTRGLGCNISGCRLDEHYIALKNVYVCIWGKCQVSYLKAQRGPHCNSTEVKGGCGYDCYEQPKSHLICPAHNTWWWGKTRVLHGRKLWGLTLLIKAWTPKGSKKQKGGRFYININHA